MTEPTRRLPDPEVRDDGKLVGKSTLTPEEMKTRGAIPVPPTKVIPVILVPGIMGSNLRANTDPSRPKNQHLNPGEPAWRPPNGMSDGLEEAGVWKKRDPVVRQQILDGDTLEVDDSGMIDIPDDKKGVQAKQMRNRWWGEVHWSSYGGVLCQLHENLNKTFTQISFNKKKIPNDFWKSVMEYDRTRWDAGNMPALTEAELEKYAQYQYPVYACGYNWIQSNELSAQRLKKRIIEVIAFWTERKFHCKQVILVTHSMGGLVARACAKQVPEKIVGVVHGVMPALGAPLAYRRITLGTETSAPGKSWVGNIALEKFSDIAGNTPARTTATMATAAGALELLPNHLYPGPWLVAAVKNSDGSIKDIANLQHSNIYDTYRDFNVWFRMIDPALADPAKKYTSEKDGGAKGAIIRAIAQAEKFHTKLLNTYYHPNSYAFYGADAEQISYGTFRWITDTTSARDEKIAPFIPLGKMTSMTFNLQRNVVLPDNTTAKGNNLLFYAGQPDTPGDGTVSQQSGAGPQDKVKRIFRTVGYDHQQSYGDDHMLMLTHHLIVRIAQEAK